MSNALPSDHISWPAIGAEQGNCRVDQRLHRPPLWRAVGRPTVPSPIGTEDGRELIEAPCECRRHSRRGLQHSVSPHSVPLCLLWGFGAPMTAPFIDGWLIGEQDRSVSIAVFDDFQGIASLRGGGPIDVVHPGGDD